MNLQGEYTEVFEQFKKVKHHVLILKKRNKYLEKQNLKLQQQV